MIDHSSQTGGIPCRFRNLNSCVSPFILVIESERQLDLKRVANLFQRGFQKFADVVGHVVFLALLLAHLLRNRFPATACWRSRSKPSSESEHRLLCLKPALRLKRRGEQGQEEAEQRDHRAVMLGDSVT